MNTRLLAGLFSMLVLLGCASHPQNTDGLNQEIGLSGFTGGPLVSDCRMPCNVSPGKDCC